MVGLIHMTTRRLDLFYFYYFVTCVSAVFVMPFSTRISKSPVQMNSIGSNYYYWKSNFKIHYEQTGDSGPPLLLVPGFGVGTYHFEHQLEELAKDFRVFSFDLLGQGQSWPDDGIVREEDALCYSADTWRDQAIYFIENIIKEPTHIAGNSLGGFLSLSVASSRKDLVKSLVLMNATPFWSFAPPHGEPNRFVPWNGVLPAPDWLLKFGSTYFDLMRNRKNIQTMLKAVYASPDSFDDTLVENIIISASKPGGHEAFTSILFSPKMNESFDAMLKKVDCPVCLIQGKEDPWIVPYWGQRAKRIKPASTYFELSPSGHCPHHETPNAVNRILEAWVKNVEEITSTTIKSTVIPSIALDTLTSSVSTGNDWRSDGNTDTENEGVETVVVPSIITQPPAIPEVVLHKLEGKYRERNGVDVEVRLVDGSPRTPIEMIGALLHKDPDVTADGCGI